MIQVIHSNLSSTLLYTFQSKCLGKYIRKIKNIWNAITGAKAPSLSHKDGIYIEVLKGKAISPHLENMAKLRIEIFSEYPYLYLGDLATEKKYLNMYLGKQDAVLVVARKSEQIVGMILGMPLQETPPEYQRCFIEKSISPKSIFYLGDIIVSKMYRGRGIGHDLYEAFEKEVLANGRYNSIAMCEILRKPNDPRKPYDYFSLDEFWRKRGYIRHRDMTIPSRWVEIGETEERDFILTVSIKKRFSRMDKY